MINKSAVWAIIKVSYNPGTNQAVGGICGTAFFLRNNLFISAHHCLNNSTFAPNPDYSKVKVFLANESGKIIEDISIETLVPEYDLAIGRVATQENIEILPAGTEFKAGDPVYNIGFPTDESILDLKLRTVGNNLIIDKLSLKSSRQEGTIAGIPRVTINASDVKVTDIPMIVLSYTSKTGFSGGPLIFNGKVIGLMSTVIPLEVNSSRPALAIPISEAQNYL